MVQVYLMNIKNLPDPKENEAVMDELPKREKDKILKFRYEKGRKQCLGARLLQHHILQMKGAGFEQITYSEHGKPEAEGFCFNLSHSGDYVICAVSDMPVGCDIEIIGNANIQVAKRFFHSQEIAYLEHISEAEKEKEFIRLWTMKESYLKMTGEGMSFSMNRFALCLEEGEIRVLREGQMQTCFLKEYDLSDCRLTVCAEENEFAEKVKHVILY